MSEEEVINLKLQRAMELAPVKDACGCTLLLRLAHGVRDYVWKRSQPPYGCSGHEADVHSIATWVTMLIQEHQAHIVADPSVVGGFIISAKRHDGRLIYENGDTLLHALAATVCAVKKEPA